MIVDLAEAVVACLDRDSARRLVRLNVREIVAKYRVNLERWKRDGIGPSPMGAVLDESGLLFVEALKKAARAVLRRPAASDPYRRK